VTLEDARRAARNLAGVANRTPLLALLPLGDELGVPVYAKPESLQRTGSFKFRGAYTRISALSAEERARGVITYSSGNHAQGVACAARLAGTKALIVMPEDAVPAKVKGTQEYGAEVVYCGYESIDRQIEAERLAAEHGYVIVPPFDDPLIVAGQATAGLEITADLLDAATVLVPIGGGGLISGVAMAIKETQPRARVIGVEPESGADAQQSLREGHIVDWPGGRSVADGLRSRRVGTLNFGLMQRYVDDIVAVSDEQILDAVAYLHRRTKLVVEPSGAVGVAALRAGAIAPGKGPVVVLLSGGNIDPQLLCGLLTGAEA
jgi:threonine dehydratase